MEKRITIEVEALEDQVSGLLMVPEDAFCLMAFSHGAGVGIEHKFMAAISEKLANIGVASLRFNFLYMEKGKRRPDVPRVAHAVQRAAICKAAIIADQKSLPVVAAGKSFGGRMFSQLAATGEAGFDALVFFGFPLHAPGKPGTKRAEHLADVPCPMFFLQGTRDTLANMDLIEEVTSPLALATVAVIDGADHGFHVLKRSGRTDEEVLDQLVELTSGWLKEVLN